MAELENGGTLSNQDPTGQDTSHPQSLVNHVLSLDNSILWLDSSQVFPPRLAPRIHPRGYQAQPFELPDRDSVSWASRLDNITFPAASKTLSKGQCHANENGSDELRK